jgi:hypothetical protein
VPLYGCAALFIREAARRFGLGWSGILALAAALGIVQAGIIDQSMFSSGYRDIDYWEAMIEPTWIAPLGLPAVTALAWPQLAYAAASPSAAVPPWRTGPAPPPGTAAT